jgi:hypothetical protein
MVKSGFNGVEIGEKRLFLPKIGVFGGKVVRHLCQVMTKFWQVKPQLPPVKHSLQEMRTHLSPVMRHLRRRSLHLERLRLHLTQVNDGKGRLQPRREPDRMRGRGNLGVLRTAQTRCRVPRLPNRHPFCQPLKSAGMLNQIYR